MKPEIGKKINLYGIFIWCVLFWVLVPLKVVKQNPFMILGFLYTIFILFVNYRFIGKDDIKYEDEVDFNVRHTYDTINLINNKAVQVSTAIFALAIACRDIFKEDLKRELLIYIIYTLVFGVGIIVPIYFISNFVDKEKVYTMNIYLARIRNVSLSYSVGFMVCAFVIVLQRLFKIVR